jgi:hypothetical protein
MIIGYGFAQRMPMKYLILFILTLTSVFADDNDITHRPKSFPYNNGKAVFVDFQEATYRIVYDIAKKKASVSAELVMDVVEEGHPVFDLVDEPTSVKINGKGTTAKVVSTPSQETSVRVLGKSLPIGRYNLEVKLPLKTLIEFEDEAVKSAFWVSDLDDRFYLERYIPSNFEYDRMKVVFDIRYLGLTKKQHIFANGEVKWLSPDHARVTFPEYFSVNSFYYHTTPVGAVELLTFPFKSLVNGKEIEVNIYQDMKQANPAVLKKFQDLTESVLNELEKDYGPFPHSSVTIYNANLSEWGLGGMEYAGATVTNYRSLPHELFHSYFARGVAPANGNAGWLDEALASWRDNRYPRLTTLLGSSQMSAHPPYTRKTDRQAYGFGSKFMGLLDGKFAQKGGLKAFMVKLLETKMFTPIFTEDFIREMESFYGEPVEPEFKKYTYGTGQKTVIQDKQHPIHRKMGLKEMKKIL